MNFLTDSNWNYVGITQRKKDLEFLNNEVWEKKLASFLLAEKNKLIKSTYAQLLFNRNEEVMKDFSIQPTKCRLTVPKPLNL